MKVILQRIKRGNAPLVSGLKYFFHTYALIALIGLLMCPAIHDLGEGAIDHTVIKGRTGIQSVLYKADKKTTSLKLVLYSGSRIGRLVKDNQNISTCSLNTFNSSITSLATTRLIL